MLDSLFLILYTTYRYMITKVNNKSPFRVTKDEIKSSSEWNKMTLDRFTKQHGDPFHIPEGDEHQVPSIDFGPTIEKPSEEELDVAVHSLEDEIKKLQEEDKKKMLPKQEAKPTPVKDDFYDDWLNE